MKKFEGFFMGIYFKGVPEEFLKTVGSAQIRQVDADFTPGLISDFTRTMMMWEFAKKVEHFGKCRCSFRENDGTLRKPVRIKPDYRGSFVLYVSKNEKLITSYEIEFFPSTDQIAICGERIYGEKPGYSRSMNETGALYHILNDLEQLWLRPSALHLCRAFFFWKNLLQNKNFWLT